MDSPGQFGTDSFKKKKILHDRNTTKNKSKKKKIDLGVTGRTKLVGMFSKKVMKWQATNSI